MTGDDMVRWHHQVSGHVFEQIPGNSEGQGSLGCCSPWGHKESDTAERPNNNSNSLLFCKVRNVTYLPESVPSRNPCASVTEAKEQA